MRTLLLTALLLATFVVRAQYTPQTVPNTKLVNNSYVSNPDNIILESTVQQIDAILTDIEQTTTAQVAVVLLESIGDQVIEDFAQELFQLWGIGRSNDNGLLILLAKDQRKVRFHTGYGLEGVLPDAVCNQIQRNAMVPAFRNDDYDAGILGGVEEVRKILTDPSYAVEITASEDDDDGVGAYTGFVIGFSLVYGLVFLIALVGKDGKFADSKQPVPSPYKQVRLKRAAWLTEYGLLPILIVTFFGFYPGENDVFYCFVTLYLYFIATLLYRMWRERRMLQTFVEKRKYFQATDYFRESQGYWIAASLFFPFPFMVYLPFHFMRKRYYRNHPRKCKICREDMIKLTELEEDPYLTSYQQVEESIRSVDYDVWKCTGCGATDAWAFPNKSSLYRVCPQCKSKTNYLANDLTLESATYTKSGKGERTHKCKACNYSRTEKYTIPKLQPVLSSSSSDSDSSSWSSSSSSGGDWGGGSSGGGGSTSSW